MESLRLVTAVLLWMWPQADFRVLGVIYFSLDFKIMSSTAYEGNSFAIVVELYFPAWITWICKKIYVYFFKPALSPSIKFKTLRFCILLCWTLLVLGMGQNTEGGAKTRGMTTGNLSLNVHLKKEKESVGLSFSRIIIKGYSIVITILMMLSDIYAQ